MSKPLVGIRHVDRFTFKLYFDEPVSDEMFSWFFFISYGAWKSVVEIVECKNDTLSSISKEDERRQWMWVRPAQIETKKKRNWNNDSTWANNKFQKFIVFARQWLAMLWLLVVIFQCQPMFEQPIPCEMLKMF